MSSQSKCVVCGSTVRACADVQEATSPDGDGWCPAFMAMLVARSDGLTPEVAVMLGSRCTWPNVVKRGQHG